MKTAIKVALAIVVAAAVVIAMLHMPTFAADSHASSHAMTAQEHLAHLAAAGDIHAGHALDEIKWAASARQAAPAAASLPPDDMGAADRLAKSPRKGEFALAMPASLQVNNAEALAPALRAGLGLALQPEFLAWEELQSGALETVMDEWQVEPMPKPPGRAQHARMTTTLSDPQIEAIKQKQQATWASGISTPRSAIRNAGSTSRSHRSRPCARQSSSRPAGRPGTAQDEAPIA